MPSIPPLVGLAEICDLLGVKRATLDTWRHRKQLPPPALVISGNPIWRRSTIEQWARKTGRLSDG